MARTSIAGRAQTATTEDFDERVRSLLIDRLDAVKGRIYQKNLKSGFSDALVKSPVRRSRVRVARGRPGALTGPVPRRIPRGIPSGTRCSSVTTRPR